jgi:hypothetical protein
MDGGNSTKRVDGSGLTDERTFRSSYHITPDQVDVFKDDVRLRPGMRQPPRPASEAAVNDDVMVSCTDNWTAANSVSEETIKVFEQTGIFVCACRHGIIETFAEMRRSGEL